MSYAEFGAAFVREAVTPERVAEVIRVIAGESVRVGPINAGPGGVALATAVGTLGELTVSRTGIDPLAYAVVLPVDLDLEVSLAGTKHRFAVDGSVRLALTVVVDRPLSVCIQPASPTYRNVTVKIRPRGMQAKVLARVGDLESELRKHVARYVRERIEADAAAFAEIDLRPLMATVADQLTGSAQR